MFGETARLAIRLDEFTNREQLRRRILSLPEPGGEGDVTDAFRLTREVAFSGWRALLQDCRSHRKAWCKWGGVLILTR